MSAVRWAREIGGFALSLLGALAGWIFIAPFALVIPKRRDWVAVIGRQHGRFLDNAKYFFLEASANPDAPRVAFITEWASDAALITGHKFEALRYPGFAAAWFLMRCSVVVVDESGWFRHGRRFLLVRARVVQLWHGVGCKRIELDRWRHEAGDIAWAAGPAWVKLRLALYRVTGRWMCYAAVICTSRFYRDIVFVPAFRARHFAITGYPRNDFARQLQGNGRALAWANVDTGIARNLPVWKREGRRVVLVAPTFRDSGATPMQMDAGATRRLDAFADSHAVEFVFKFHPSERNADQVHGRHLHVCACDSDIYPVLPEVAALITDYSSISTDFVLLDKPLLFLIPEKDDYARNERQLQFDPRSMMPGPIVPDWASLLDALVSEWDCDTHAAGRAALRTKAFDDLPQSQAVNKLLALLRAEEWIRPAAVLRADQPESRSR